LHHCFNTDSSSYACCRKKSFEALIHLFPKRAGITSPFPQISRQRQLHHPILFLNLASTHRTADGYLCTLLRFSPASRGYLWNGPTPIHQRTPLSLSSPYVKYDILPFNSYANCIFSFKSPKALGQFAGADETDRIVKVRAEYGKLSRCHHTDWIFLLFKHFGDLKGVAFALEAVGRGINTELFEQWWGCVRDAMRGIKQPSQEIGQREEDWCLSGTAGRH
jgi:hypothetical protein